ncbi:MAG TPA: hypothetical protein VK404_18595 [Spirosoma sp.]|jgi:hypothetical protein|nr:hypothetical protein [Spirosoma sp.]
MIDDILSSDNTYKVSFCCYEVRMSHWIKQPHLIRVGDNQTLFSLNGASWSAFTVKWRDDETVDLQVCKYPGRIACSLVLNAALDEGTVVGPSGSYAGTLREVSHWILKLY